MRLPGTSGAIAALLCICTPMLMGAADVNRFRTPAVPDGLIGISGTDALAPLHVNAAASIGYGYNVLTWRFDDGTYEPIIEHQLAMDVVVSMGIIRFIDIAVGVPVLLWQDGPPPASPNDPDPFNISLGDIRGSGLGDLRIVPRLQFADERGFGFGGAFESEITFNTGELAGGRGKYFGEPGVAWRPRVVTSFPLSFGRIIASLGVRIRNTEQLADAGFDHEWEYHAGAEFYILRDSLPLSALVELAGANSIGFQGSGQFNLEALGGVRTRLPGDIVLTAAVGFGLAAGLGTPTLRGTLSVAWAPRAEDQDNDGIPDNIDACPYAAEDYDGFEDGDGCADTDNDEDGIPDDDDKCPDSPEDFNDFKDDDGCPDADQVDTDEDGIPDSVDRCPAAPEDKDGFKDDDGCPELDNDIDGVPDDQDQCPSEKETINGVDDYDGCPDEGEGLTELVETMIEIKETILFESGKAIIKQQSTGVLDQVALVILSHPEIVMVRIEGHTDSQGNEEDNLFLSQDRADSVRRYLIGRGVPRENLEAIGYGESRPIDTNSTSSGRTKNRRVDFVIVQSRDVSEE